MKDVGVIASSLLMLSLDACNRQTNPDNSQLNAELRLALDLPTDFTRQQLAQQSAELMCDPTWKINSYIGDYFGRNGVTIPIKLNEIGQMAGVTLDANKPDDIKAYKASQKLKYPSPRSQVSKDIVFSMQLANGSLTETHVIVYGTVGTVGRLGSNIESLFNQALPPMFDFVQTDVMVVHLNFMPLNMVNYLDVNGLGYIPNRSNFPGHTHIIPYDNNVPDGPLKRLDLYLSAYPHHTEELLFGLTHSENFHLTLVNEMDGLLGRYNPDFNIAVASINEAHSTLMGWLAVVEPQIVPKVLGGNAIERAVAAIGEEMDILADIGAK